MQTLLRMTLLQFKMLLRNRALLASSLGLAVVSMLVFGFAFGNNDNAGGALGLADLDHTASSARVIAGFKANPTVAVTTADEATLIADLEKDKYSAVVTLEPGFEAGLLSNTARVRLYIDNANLLNAGRMRALITAVFGQIGKQARGFQDPITVEEQQVSVRQRRQIDFLTPGMIGVTIMFANMFVGIALMTWRERGTLKRLSATPLRSWQLIGSQIISQLLLSFVQVGIILLLATLLFQVQVDLAWLPGMAVLVAAGTFSIVALGYVVANFVQRREAAQTVVTLVTLPMMFLAGSYFPVSVPAFAQPLVNVLPLTQLNSAIRQIMLNDAGVGSVLPNLLTLFATGVLLLALSIRTFRWSWGK